MDEFIHKAYALTRFIAATPAEDRAAALGDENPIIGRTPLDRISVRRLNEATERIRRASARPTNDPEAKAARRAGRELQAKLSAGGRGGLEGRPSFSQPHAERSEGLGLGSVGDG